MSVRRPTVFDTDRDLLIKLHARFDYLEDTLSELTNATADLTRIVDVVLPLVDRAEELQAQVQTLTNTLSDERLADQVEDEGFRNEITAARDEAASAAQSIEGDVARLREALPTQEGEPTPEPDPNQDGEPFPA